MAIGGKPRILIIDDDEDIRHILQAAMEKHGFWVETAGDGEEGLRTYAASPADVVVTDILMPEKEGIATIIELKREYPKVKIIAISGGGSVGPDTYLTMARELGADRILSKPFSMSKLIEMIEELL